MRTPLARLGTVVAFCATSTAVHAQLLGSTVNIDAHNGFTNGGYLCKDATASRTVSGGGELLGSDWTNSCVGYYSADITNSGFTLTVAEGGNYSFATLHLNFVGASPITAAAFAGYSNGFFDGASGYGYDDTNLVPTVTWDASNVWVTWNTGDDNFPSGQFRFADGSVGTGQAAFRVATGVSSVPEPSTVMLLGGGLLGIAGFVRRRTAA